VNGLSSNVVSGCASWTYLEDSDLICRVCEGAVNLGKLMKDTMNEVRFFGAGSTTEVRSLVLHE
jgi:hypothetical protein